MSTIDAAHLKKIILVAAQELQDRRNELDQADAALGDGDTGTMLATASHAVIATLADKETNTPGEVLAIVAQAIKGSTGSSLGTLLALGLRSISRSVGDSATITEQQAEQALVTAAEKMKLAGGASSGDKTIIDSVEALAQSPFDAVSATEAVLADFRDKPCMAGRARLYPEASRGADDPGMLAAAIIARATAEI